MKIQTFLILPFLVFTLISYGNLKAQPKSYSNMLKLNFKSEFNAANTKNLMLKGEALSVSPNETSGLFISNKIKIPILNYAPYLSFSVNFKLNPDLFKKIKVSVRGSKDGTNWANYFELKADEHLLEDEDGNRDFRFISHTTFEEKGVKYIQLKLELLDHAIQLENIQLYFFSPGDFTPTTKSVDLPNNAESASCTCPAIPYYKRAEWGLTAQAEDCPVYNPNKGKNITHKITSPITNIIIHHSEGSIKKPYSARVYDIWNLHVNNRGWADIGYHWLIDPEGNLYKGRAWNNNKENVLGAHTCGCHDNKIGICILGSFTNDVPTQAAKNTLTKLLAWKACQFSIDPLNTLLTATNFDFAKEPQTICESGTKNSIDGHKGVCATECPGNMFYPQLDQIRTDVNNLILTCAGQPNNFSISGTTSCIGTNPYIALNWTSSNSASTYEIYLNGSLWKSNLSGNAIQIPNLNLNTNYTIYMKAINNNGKTSSNTITIKTPINCVCPFAFTVSGSTSCANNILEVSLNWTASGGAATYSILRNGSEIKNGLTTTNYIDKNIAAGSTYNYYIKAVNANCPTGTTSNSIAVSVPSNCCPGSFTITGNASCVSNGVQATLNWSSASGVTSYSIYRNGQLIASNVTGNSYINKTLSFGTSYTYVVKSINASCINGTSSNSLVIATPQNCCPTAPTLTVVMSCNGSTAQASISWTNSTGASSYTLYQNGGVLASGISGNNYLHSGLTSGGNYSYYVKAINASCPTGKNSNTVTATAPSSCCPGTFTLTSTPGCNNYNPNIVLNWNASSGASSYDLYRNNVLYFSNIAGTTFNNTNVVAGTNYTFYIKAVKNGCSGGTNSNTVSSTAQSNCCTGNLNLTANATCNGSNPQVSLSWSSSSGATSYDLYRNNALYYSNITGTSFLNTNVSPGTSYSYYVKAKNLNCQQSTNSNAVNITTPTSCCPGGFTLTSNSSCNGSNPQITLNWSSSTGASSYDIYRNNVLYSSSVYGTSFINTNVTPGSSYTYFIKAKLASCPNGTNSNTISTTAPSSCCPGSFTLNATPQCSGPNAQINLSWSTSSGATSYDLYRNNVLYYPGLTGTSFLNTNVSPGTTYSYYVKAKNAACPSGTNSNTTNALAPNTCCPGAFTLSATPACNGSSSRINLSWTPSTGATTYDVYRNGSMYYTGLTGNSFINTNVAPGTTYSYYIKAIKSGCAAGTNSNTVSAKSPSCSAPADVEITLDDEEDGIPGESFDHDKPIRINAEIKLHPNPAREYIIAELSVAENAESDFTLSILNTAGKLMGKFELQDASELIEIPLDNYFNGTYICVLSLHDKIIATKKFIVQK